MSQTIEINQGEYKVKFITPTAGKISFEELGFKQGEVKVEGGFLRMIFDFEGIGEHQYFKVPTIEIEYNQAVADTHWLCDFNETTILDKVDHFGHSTVLLLDRNKLSSLEHHHENKLVLHAEFPDEVTVNVSKSYVNFFK